MARFRVLFVLSLAAIALVACLPNSALNTEPAADPIEFRVFSLEEVFAGALAKALEWKSDAYLTGASFVFRPASNPKGRWGSLGFRSASSQRDWLGIFVTEGSEGFEYELRSGEFSRDDKPLGDPITPDQLAVDTAEALEIGQRNGGRDFIREGGESMFWPQDLYLEYLDDVNRTGPVIWRVVYSYPIGTGPSLSIQINAETGELLETTYREGSLSD
ncbi:MAG: hypothetical protein ACC700_10170 [Anaerolineales bacterium]